MKRKQELVFRTIVWDERKAQLTYIDIPKDRNLAEYTFRQTWKTLIQKLPKGYCPNKRMIPYYKDCISQLVSYNVQIVQGMEVIA